METPVVRHWQRIHAVSWRKLLTFILLLLTSCHATALAASDKSRPNHVLFVADDLGFSDLGCSGNEIETPRSQYSKVIKRISKTWDLGAKVNHVRPLPKDYRVQYITVAENGIVEPSAPKSIKQAVPKLSKIFEARGFSLDDVELPTDTKLFPIQQLKNLQFELVAKFDWFPEGPTYRPSDGSYFFAGNQALTRVDAKGQLHEVLGQPGGGGTHLLPDGSVLIIGHVGLRRLFPDGRVALLADGAKIGKGNDLSMGIHKEVYFSVPSSGIYRLTAGENGKLEKVSEQGCNGLDVDLSGEFLYVARSNIERYKIDIASDTLGKPETVYEFPKGQGGGDGCAFDAWGNFYSMRFRTGVIRVINPHRKEMIAEIPVGVVPASNLTFGGPRNSELFVTAGAPKHSNCQVLKTNLDVTGFCGHVGATTYPLIRFLEQRGDAKRFSNR